MNNAGKCSECGAQLPEGHAVRGLCPRCLLSMGLKTDGDADLQTIGAYEIERLLGRGGMGIVYKARQVSLNRVVALKILHPNLSNDPAFVKRFHREAQAVARLNHQHIVQIHDIGEENGVHFFSMEYIKGRLVNEILEQEGFLQVDHALDIIYQVARALKFAHSKNIIHRDIKPSNIIVDQVGRVKVMDFGLAKLGGQTKLTKTDTVLGTVNYMSPEQAKGETVDHRSDIWSMGVVLYEMLAGRSPFRATNEAALIHKIIYESVPDLQDLSPDIPSKLKAIVTRAMSRDLEKRYQSVADFMKDLQDFKGPEPKGGARPLEKSRQYLDKAVGFLQEKSVCKKLLIPLALVAIVFAGYLANSKWPTQNDPGPEKVSTIQQEPTKKAKTVSQKAMKVNKEAPEGMVLIPAGEFMMGTAVGGRDDEHPQRNVYLDAFFMDKYEVTNVQFKQFADATGYATDAEKQGFGTIWMPGGFRSVDGANWRSPQGPKSSIDEIMDHPVVQVSWNDAVAYAEWAGKRLPTEAEWEKASRGTDGRKYPWGNSEPDGSQCNFGDKNVVTGKGDTNSDDGYKYTSPVGTYEAGKSPYGVYDMSGNVWEWCADWSSSDYYRNSPSRNPENKARGKSRVTRGASFFDGRNGMRSADRSSGSRPDAMFSGRGFRCAMDANINAKSNDAAKEKPSAKTIALQPESTNKSKSTSPTATKITKEAPEGMVLIPAGEFMMGTETGGQGDEHPQHKVYLDAFFIDKYEVTNAKFKKFTDATKYVTDNEKQGFGTVVIAGVKKNVDGANWRHPRGRRKSNIDGIMNHPVVQISWDDAVAYAKWAGKRLPTEAEWEKAARGTDGREYPWGSTEPDGSQANFGNKNSGDGYKYTSPVGTYEAGRSPYGLYDMAGNVSEYCSDWYAPDYYVKTPSRNPENKVEDKYRAMHGGAWDYPATGLRSADRRYRTPSSAHYGIGFRCARDVE